WRRARRPGSTLKEAEPQERIADRSYDRTRDVEGRPRSAGKVGATPTEPSTGRERRRHEPLLRVTRTLCSGRQLHEGLGTARVTATRPVGLAEVSGGTVRRRSAPAFFT